jgi:cell division protein ZapA (FtsZ GTPase activity inhibitor)
MSEVSITIELAGRNYPIRIEKSMEGSVREAVNLINKKMNEMRENYAVKDTQDLLAMAALQLFSANIDQGNKIRIDEDIALRLVELEQFVNDYLNEKKNPIH